MPVESRSGTVDEGDEPSPQVVASEVPPGVGPEVFREHLQQLVTEDEGSGAQITLQENVVFLEDIEVVEEEPGTNRSRVRLRNGLIIGGITGAAIIGALATIRYRRRHRR
jgi:hypothetical protein